MPNFPSHPLKIAIIQQPPAFLNLSQSLQRAAAFIHEAHQNGAQLIVFGETWFCGYPAWLDHLPNIALWDHPATQNVYAQMLQNGIKIGGPADKTLAGLAKQYNIYLIAGVNEVIDSGYGNGSIFNSLLTYNNQGLLINHHRKLMPTFTEKLLYASGDGHGLKTHPTPFGRLGSLICWEHWMPLTRQALHQQNEHLHIAVWPAVKDLHQLASRHYAFEGNCYVIAAGQVLRVKDLPEAFDLPEKLRKDPEQFLLNGGSSVIKPNGAYLIEPQFDRETILYVTIENWEETLHQRLTLDVSGHYHRPDIFDFKINFQRYGSND